MADCLASLPEHKVAAWYRRLADRIGKEKVENQEPLAAIFLRHWLDNRNPNSTYKFSAPNYLRQSPYILSTLRYHRNVFLTQERAKLPSGRRAWAGVLPRIQGLTGFKRWDLKGMLEMQYESLVEVGSGPFDIARIQMSGTPQERDLLTALRGFQLRSRVRVIAASSHNSGISIRFFSWMSCVIDKYDFDYSEHFTVPNPDYGSTSPDAVLPHKQMITVYHKNAGRLERSGFATPYRIESQEWSVNDIQITRPGDVDPRRRL